MRSFKRSSSKSDGIVIDVIVDIGEGDGVRVGVVAGRDGGVVVIIVDKCGLVYIRKELQEANILLGT